MKVTRDWVCDFFDISNYKTSEISDKLNSIGLEVEEIIEFKVPDKILTGKVLSVEKHQDSDKLNLVKVDIGSSVLDIVCGASNVIKGSFVPVATLGAIMPDGLEIKPVKLRGELSNGMICSSNELGLGSFNDGILVLDSSIGELVKGKNINEYPLFNNILFDIDITPNMGIANSIFGLARELSIFFDKVDNFKENYKNSDIIYSRKTVSRVLSVNNELDGLNLAYMGLDFKDNHNLPLLVIARLSLTDNYNNYSENEDINKLVDYLTLTTGLVLRAYNFDSLIGENKNRLMLNTTKNELNGLYELYIKDVLISIVGNGKEYYKSSKSINNSQIFFEATYIDSIKISKLNFESVELSLNDSMFNRSKRGSEKDILNGLEYLKHFFNRYFKVDVFSNTLSSVKELKENRLSVSIKFINSILGMNYNKVELIVILGKLRYDILSSNDETIFIKLQNFKNSPSFNKFDLVTDVLRFINFDNIKSMPLNMLDIKPNFYNYSKYNKIKEIIYSASSAGFSDVIHYTFNNSKKYDELNLDYHDKSDFLNPINENMDILRSTLEIGLIEAVSNNRKYSERDFLSFFEIGEVFNKDLIEDKNVSFIYSKNREDLKLKNIDILTNFIYKVSSVIGLFNINDVELINPLADNFQSGEIIIEGRVVGNIFKLHKVVEEKYNLLDTYICNINLHYLFSNSIVEAKPFSKYQKNKRDFSILVQKDLKYSDTLKVLNEIKFPDTVVDFYPVDLYYNAKMQKEKSLTIRFIVQSLDHTMNEDELSNVHKVIIDLLSDKNFKIK